MTEHWQPSASLETLAQRAKIIKQLRHFFYARNYLEVETPILGSTTVTDPHLHSLQVGEACYLQTSPEFHMKRLLAAGSGQIFQIAKSFRRAELGQHHNPEFTLLEWYHLDYDHHQLMDEMDELLNEILKLPSAMRYTYREIFQKILKIDPFTNNEQNLQNCVVQQGIKLSSQTHLFDQDTLLDLLLSHCIQPKLGFDRPVYLYDFPASQAALAKCSSHSEQFAERFEVYLGGMEIANGYHELTDATELKERFERDVATRQQYNLPAVPLDNKLIAAHISGLPDCAGVALGVDRLIMFALQKSSIDQVMSFSMSHA